jgi:hypothetical protein
MARIQLYLIWPEGKARRLTYGRESFLWLVGEASRLTSSMARIQLYLIWPEGKARRLSAISKSILLSPFVIGYHGIQLASFVLVIEFNDMKAQKSMQTNFKRSIPIMSTEISGSDTNRAVEDYQGKNMWPITGQPDQRLNALLSILSGYEASLHD